MKLSPPKGLTFWISVILVVLGLIGQFTSIPVLHPYAFWFVVVGFVVLFLGNLVKGL